MPTIHKTNENRKQQIFNTLAVLRLSINNPKDKMLCDMIMQRIRQEHKIEKSILNDADMLINKWSK